MRSDCALEPQRIDALESARAAGLRYVNDTMAGIRRRRSGTSFTYLDSDGSRVRDPETLARIRALAIPPAWTDVWISRSPLGHLQATGRDARGRKQYRYHPRWREVRDETKYGRMIAFGDALPSLRARVRADLRRSGLPREKVLAAVVRLMDGTYMRVGNAEYARDNDSFGLTTLRDRHVTVSGGTLRFRFRGKSGKEHVVSVDDRRLARIVKACRDIPGQELFQYEEEEGGGYGVVESADVNAYLREATGQDFTAKDFRTWAGTVFAACALHDLGPPASQRGARKRITRALEDVAGRLGNTVAVTRKCYVHPDVIEGYVDGDLHEFWQRRAPRASKRNGGLRPEERVVLAYLKHRARRAADKPRNRGRRAA